MPSYHLLYVYAGKELCTLCAWISDLRNTGSRDPGSRITAFAAFKIGNNPGDTRLCSTCEQAAAHYSRSPWPGGANWMPMQWPVPRVWRGERHKTCNLQLSKAPGDPVCATHGGPTIGAPDRWTTEGHRAKRTDRSIRAEAGGICRWHMHMCRFRCCAKDYLTATVPKEASRVRSGYSQGISTAPSAVRPADILSEGMSGLVSTDWRSTSGPGTRTVSSAARGGI